MVKIMQIYGFYAGWDVNSKEQIQKLKDFITDIRDISFISIDIDDNKTKWDEYGLKTIPGIVITKGEKCICFFAGKLNFEEIKKQVMTYSTQSNMELEYKIENFVVKESSSCHRYDRWNEQCLLLDASGNGWSSISSKDDNSAYLVIDMFKKHKIRMIGIRPREWELNEDLKDSFPDQIDIYVSNDEVNWQLADSFRNIEKNSMNEKFFKVNPIIARFLKLVFTVNNLRKERKFFVQLIKLDIFGCYDENLDSIPCSPSFNKISDESKYTTEVANKQGIFMGENVTSEIWYLNNNQKIGDRICYQSRVLIVPLCGEFELGWGKENKRLIKSNEWIIIPSNCVHYIKNVSETKACFLEVKDKVPSICAWSVRQ